MDHDHITLDPKPGTECFCIEFLNTNVGQSDVSADEYQHAMIPRQSLSSDHFSCCVKSGGNLPGTKNAYVGQVVSPASIPDGTNSTGEVCLFGIVTCLTKGSVSYLDWMTPDTTIAGALRSATSGDLSTSTVPLVAIAYGSADTGMNEVLCFKPFWRVHG